MIDRGSGPVVVLIPGVQGRWEWMAPTVQALARRCRVLTFSLAADPAEALAQVDAALDHAGVNAAAICGVSLGGMIALHYAASRPARVSALVLASTPGPAWEPDRIQAFCARYGSVTAPVFVGAAMVRMWPELLRARGGWLRALPAIGRQGLRVLAHPASPGGMRRRLAWWLAIDRAADARRVQAPALVLAGDDALDRVVPASGTREYASYIRGARFMTIENTGHVGVITRPDRFAEIVSEFVKEKRGTVPLPDAAP